MTDVHTYSNIRISYAGKHTHNVQISVHTHANTHAHTNTHVHTCKHAESCIHTLRMHHNDIKTPE